MDYFITEYNKDSIELPDAECAVLEDSIMHKGRLVTAGSGILGNFVSPLNATVVTRIETAGIHISGKTIMDEFGIAGLFPDEQPEHSGAVSAVADGIAAFALCNDYTGAVGQQAAARGLYYLQPTYGTVSRYGLIPAVPSMDQIGIVCKTPEDGFRILSIISGHDPKDGAMYARGQGTGEKGQRIVNPDRPLTIGIPKNIFAGTQGSASSAGFIGIGLTGNFDTVEIELKYFDVYAQVMQILCFAELSGNTSRYDGIKYGYRTDSFADLQELYIKSRTEALGQNAKLASILGAMVLSQENYSRYYDKAMRIRRLIRDSLEFDKYNVIVLPVPDTTSNYRLEQCALPRLCGLPAVTAPVAGGITLVADVNHEDDLFAVLKEVR